MRKIYMDNSATTRTRKEVFKVMKKYYKTRYGNPSSIHKHGMIAKGSVEMARESIAFNLIARTEQLIFTGSGSEANNTAIYSALKAYPTKKHIITSKIEHSSVYNTINELEDSGYRITYLDVNKQGRYNLDHLKQSITDETVLISLSYANNEVGTIQDVNSISDMANTSKVLLHLDAVQALPYEEINLTELQADYVSFSGHKLYAPKGIGLLYLKSPHGAASLIKGGGQEFDLRSGTENVAYIVALAKAIDLNKKEKLIRNDTLKKLRDQIIHHVINTFDDVVLTGDPINRVPNIASFAFKNISSKSLVRRMAIENISISSGSACSAKQQAPSRILTALGYSSDYTNGGIRISLGKYNKKADLIKLFTTLKLVLHDELRNGSKETSSQFVSLTEFNGLKEDASVQIIDVRPFTKPTLGLMNHQHIPFWNLKRQSRNLDKNKSVVLICNDGDVIAPMAQFAMIKQGFKDVRVLKGGAGTLLNHTK